MSWTDPAGHVYAVSEVVSATTLNTYVKDNLLYLYAATSANIASQQGTAFTTASTSFVDWGGGTPFTQSFTKRGDSTTNLLIRLNTSFFVTGGVADVFFAALVNGVDNAYPSKRVDTLSNHEIYSGVVIVAGLAAGTYSVRLRVKMGAQTFNLDTLSFAEFAIQEVHA